MKKYLIFFLLLPLLFCFSGCGGKKKPTDLPALYPVKITVIQDGNPLEGATVYLAADGAGHRFSTGAITDQNGVATIKTDGEWPGAPAGKYKVSISKVVSPPEDPVDPSLSFEERRSRAMARAAIQPKSVVDSQFSVAKTPLSIEVTTSGVKETFDVGAAVEEQISRGSGG